jgi:hypothetical protein
MFSKFASGKGTAFSHANCDVISKFGFSRQTNKRTGDPGASPGLLPAQLHSSPPRAPRPRLTVASKTPCAPMSQAPGGEWVWNASNEAVLSNFLTALIAVVLGNAIYFLVLMPLLPAAGRHGIARIDLGLLIDFWVCLAVFGVIHLVLHRKSAGAGNK